VAGHEGIELDTSRLVYTIVAQEDGVAQVAVTGDMAVKATIPLVEKKGQWVLDPPPVAASAAEAHGH
jgi:hypothetical protein